MEELAEIIKALDKRIETLELLIAQSIVVEKLAADPVAVTGKIYYNTVSNKYKVCENGTWKTMTTS